MYINETSIRCIIDEKSLNYIVLACFKGTMDLLAYSDDIDHIVSLIIISLDNRLSLIFDNTIDTYDFLSELSKLLETLVSKLLKGLIQQIENSIDVQNIIDVKTQILMDLL